MDKKDIVEVLERIGTMMEIKGENPFKVRAYFSGARTLQTMEEDLETVIGEGRLGDVPGIGKALTEKIETLFATGELEFYDKLLASVPPGLLDLLDIPGLGGKKIKALHEQLEIDSIESLTEACNEGKVAGLKGFGEKTAKPILPGTFGGRREKSRTVSFPAWRNCLRSNGSKRRGVCAGVWRRWETSIFWSLPPTPLRSWTGLPPWKESRR
jgi:DNA polymerase (family 10)